MNEAPHISDIADEEVDDIFAPKTGHRSSNEMEEAPMLRHNSNNSQSQHSHSQSQQNRFNAQQGQQQAGQPYSVSSGNSIPNNLMDLPIGASPQPGVMAQQFDVQTSAMSEGPGFGQYDINAHGQFPIVRYPDMMGLENNGNQQYYGAGANQMQQGHGLKPPMISDTSVKYLAISAMCLAGMYIIYKFMDHGSSSTGSTVGTAIRRGARAPRGGY